MSIVIFYECEEVTSETRTKALSGREPESLIEVCAEDTVFSTPDLIPDNLKRLMARRDPKLIGRLMNFWNDIAEALPNLEYRGVSVMKVIRYEWIYTVARLYYRAWVIRQLIEEFDTKTVLWVCDDNAFPDFLHDVCVSEGVELVVFNRKSVLHSLGQGILQEIKVRAHKVKTYLLHQYWCWRQGGLKSTSDANQKVYLLAEYFPSSALLAANTYGQRLENTEGCSVVYLAGTRTVAKQWQDLGKNPLLIEQPGFRERFEILRSGKKIGIQCAEALRNLPSEKFRLEGSSVEFKQYFVDGFRRPLALKVNETLTSIWQATHVLAKNSVDTVISMTYTSIFGAVISHVAGIA